jgi:hypothetical protein
MTEGEFSDLIAVGHEVRGVEFKGPGSARDKHLMAKVVRAVLSMANHRDGGLVIVGVREGDATLEPDGLSDADLKTWTYDYVTAQIARYADPAVSLDMETLRHEGRPFVVLQVQEFDELPVVCKASFEKELRNGAVYVRSRRTPETVEIPSQTEMRELLQLAAEKHLRAYLAQSQRAGVLLTGQVVPGPAEGFAAELAGLSDSTVYQTIIARGHWRVVIRPSTHASSRLAEEDLFPLMEQTFLRRGSTWFPHVNPNELPTYGSDWIGQERDQNDEPSIWRFFCSGQLAQVSGMASDWEDRSSPYHPDPDMPERTLNITDAILRLTEAFLFAGRLAVTPAGDPMMHVEITVIDLKGRSLWYSRESTPRYQEKRAEVPTCLLRDDFGRGDLVANARQLAVRWAVRLFLRFKWEPPIQAIEGIQDNLRLG